MKRNPVGNENKYKMQSEHKNLIPLNVGAGTIEAIRSVTCDDVTLHFAFEKHNITLRFRFVVLSKHIFSI